MALDLQKHFCFNVRMNLSHMKRAIELSKMNVQGDLGGPFGAVVVKGDKIIGEGANSVTRILDPTAHAEVQAIREACLRLKDFSLAGCEIYTSCEPCPMCLSAIYWARIDKIYYANTQADAASIDFDDAFLYRELKLEKEQRQLPVQQILREEAFEVFKLWKNSSSKVPY